ncbi:MAG TPA: aldolase/citrate lyase family protein [Candidatus Limnocylindrales bacterium]|nr:aldolase/citrate lyase family protein [Candidatus Limnocylindrales bacterium]
MSATPLEPLRARILRGETTLGTFLNLGSPVAAELCGQAGFDWLILDMEHGALTEAGLLQMLHAVAATPAEAVVRVEEGTRLRIGRALDLGARALMVPRVDTAEQARQAVSFVRYPPSGTRGIALPTRFAGYGRLTHADVATAHEDVTLMIQVESQAAVDAADEFASIDGVDVLFVGPTDLSHDLGVPGDIGSGEYRRAVERVGRAANDAGKAAGVLLWTIDDMALYADAGYRVYALGSDGGSVVTAARRQVAEFRERAKA